MTAHSVQRLVTELNGDELITVEQLRQSREVARNMMFMKYPSILVDAQHTKMQKRMTTEEYP